MGPKVLLCLEISQNPWDRKPDFLLGPTLPERLFEALRRTLKQQGSLEQLCKYEAHLSDPNPGRVGHRGLAKSLLWAFRDCRDYFQGITIPKYLPGHFPDRLPVHPSANRRKFVSLYMTHDTCLMVATHWLMPTSRNRCVRTMAEEHWNSGSATIPLPARGREVGLAQSAVRSSKGPPRRPIANGGLRESMDSEVGLRQ